MPDGLALYSRLREHLAGTAWDPLFLMYGTLLAAVRDKTLPAGDDLDCAYLSRHRERSAADELKALAFKLIDAGFAVHATPAELFVTDPDAPAVRVKIFHLYTDDSGALALPFGAAGSAPVRSILDGAATTSQLNGATVVLPPRPEQLLELLYGPGWRLPDPEFSWAKRRTDAAPNGRLSPAAVEEIYWADFYARTFYESGSTFCDLVRSRPDLPATALDIGCGDGRDSFALARGGLDRVTGIDRSHIGLAHAQRKAADLGLADRVSFTVCDVSDRDSFTALVLRSRFAEESMLFYARFFLHSITDEVQRTLLQAIDATARTGDWFAAEFRTDRDELVAKTHGQHYRRFQNGPAFGRALHELYSFTPFLEQEGNGFSPYRGEDPYLYRVIARRTEGSAPLSS